MPTPHIHKEAILAFAEGAEIQVMESGQWIDCMPYPTFDSDHAYRVKPAAPKWPQTTMAEDSILSAWYNGNDVCGPSAEIWAMIRVANAAIAHSCESGQLVPADKVRDIEAKALLFGREEGEKRSENRDREVMWFALQRGPTCPTSEELDNLVRMVKK